MQNCHRAWGVKMSSHSWLDVWNLFLELLSRQSIAAQIAAGLGAAFVAVMTLEGLRASFFPKRILKGLALRDAVPAPPACAAPAAEEADIRTAWTPVDVPAFPPAAPANPLLRPPVNAAFVRRSSPRRMRIIGQRKPS